MATFENQTNLPLAGDILDDFYTIFREMYSKVKPIVLDCLTKNVIVSFFSICTNHGITLMGRGGGATHPPHKHLLISIG